MIVASPKPISEIRRSSTATRRSCFVGCGTCVTVCLAGGEREVGIMAYAMRMARSLAKQARRDRAGHHRAPVRERVHQGPRAGRREGNEAVVSFGCGAGVQALAERFPGKPVYAALNTQFLGILEEQAVWTEKCLACGDCMLAEFGGICPVTRCAKHLLNGPCGGSTEEHCEVDTDQPVRLATHLQAPQGHRPARPPAKRSARPRTGGTPGTAAHGRSCARNTGSEQSCKANP